MDSTASSHDGGQKPLPATTSQEETPTRGGGQHDSPDTWPLASGPAPSYAEDQGDPLLRTTELVPPPAIPRPPPAIPRPPPAADSGGKSKRNGVTAAEALAAELHREIARRVELEERLAQAEDLLAARVFAAPPTPPSAPAPAPVPETAPPAAPAADFLGREELERRLATAERRLVQAEQKLVQGEQRLAYLTTSSPMGFFDVDLISDTAYYSSAYKEMLGFRADELPDTQHTFSDLLHPEDRQNDWMATREPIGEGLNRFVRQFRLRHKDGTYRWVESTGTEFINPAGERVRTLGFHRDVTARKALEERLHQSEERFNLIVTSSPLGFFDSDFITGRSYLSPLWKAMLGFRPDELPDLNQTWIDLLHPDDRAEALAIHSERLYGESRRPYSHTSRRRHKDGTYRWMQSSGIDFFAPDGRLVRTLGFMADIHALKTAEQALAHEKESLRVTLDSISDGVITTDAMGQVAYLNAAAESLCGLDTAEAHGLPVEEFYRRAGAQLRRQADNPVRAVLATGLRAAPHDPAHLHAAGRPERVVSDNGAPIFDPAGTLVGAVLVFHDITDRHRAAEELQKAGRIESLGVLAGGIAHDFNNLLTAMLGNLSVARSGGELPARAIDALGRAEKACWRARDLTGQLLTFAKGGDPVRKTAELMPMIEGAVRSATQGTAVQASFHFEEALPAVEADEGQIVQVLHNLALNAVQAMPGGGSLQLSGGLVTSSEGLAAIGDAAITTAGPYVEIVLRDSGTGIAPEHLSKIFDPFFSTRSNGTGLGLAIAYSIIRKHDGVIRVDSRPGAGSTFTIYLPVSPQAEPLSSERAAPPRPRSGGRVLFMDDDPDIRDLAGAILGLIGYEAELTCEGAETLTAYQNARAEGQPFAAVILDLTIPGGMGGKETIRRLREIDPGVRAIVSSGYSNDAVIADFRAHGFMGMVAKPYRMEDLARVLTEAVAGTLAAAPA